MKSVSIVLAAGILALVAQGGIGTFLPPPWCPNLGLLVVIGLGLHWPGLASGLLLATALGYATDLVSGSLMGQHALVWLFVFSAARLAGRRVNLRGAVPLASFAAGTTFFLAGAQLSLIGLFADVPSTLGWGGFADVARHALANAAVAPLASIGMAALLSWAGEDETRRLELSPTRSTL